MSINISSPEEEAIRRKWQAEDAAWETRDNSDYHDGIEEGWKAGAEQERRIWEQAVALSLGTIPDGLAIALAEVRAGLEGE